MPNIAVANGTLVLLGLLTLLAGASVRFGIGIGLMTFGAVSCVIYLWNTRGARHHGPG